MGQALYRKHRPKTLKEVVGQEHITQTLQKALQQGQISHAYLFTGPRGVGKTSIARILAHEINKLPYADDAGHIDIIEIDAASNRRIDEIRDLRDKVYVAPAQAKYKVYIIDEVHMLTREAFNALLKTLEEPPAHVVFILATTDAHKLPETIVSRTQRFTFKPVAKTKVIDHLQSIAKSEGIKASPEALELLAEHGEGSFRDSISLLDQARSHSEALEASEVHQLLGIPSDQALQTLANTLVSGSAAELMQQLTALYDQGLQAAAIAKQLAQMIRSQLADNKLTLGHERSLELLGKLVEVPAAHDPQRFLEIILLQTLRPTTPASTVPTPTSSKAEEPAKKALKVEPQPAVTVVSRPAKPKNAGTAVLDEAIWPQVLAELKKKHNTLYGVVRMAEPGFSEGVLSLSFAFAFHEKRLKENANRQKIADIIYELTGQTVDIDCLLDKTVKAAKPAEIAKKPAPDPNLSAISNIFGGAELLES